MNGLTFASCQKWDDGFYTPYRFMADEDIELVVHLGDYIYEYGVGSGGVRHAKVPSSFAEECFTLERYRLQHALYKTDPDLQEAHRLFPWMVTWDDHEVDNDYSGVFPEFENTSTEFVGTSISSNGDFEVYGPYYGPMIPFNPDIKFFDGDRRGYVLCTLDHDEWRTDLRMVSSVWRRNVSVSTFASFVVEDGQPGAQQV